MPHLAEDHYGKSLVRLVKVDRSSESHELSEWSVDVSLTGAFQACFLDGDNRGLLATDTMKNTVYALARSSSARTIEDFSQELAIFLLARNEQVTSVRVNIEESKWIHLETAGDRHPTAFQQRGPEVATTSVMLIRDAAPVIRSGISGLVIMKTAHSAFAGFKRDELTTLPDTDDRLLGTEAAITWLYAGLPTNFAETRGKVMEELLKTFARHHSRSVQETLYAMAVAALEAEPLLAELTLTMPNRHNIPIDFSRFSPPFNLSNDNTIFVPQDEPSGHIHARVVR